MADDVSNYAYLNYLRARVVRGAVPSYQNLKTSSLIFVDAEESSAAEPVKEYMLTPRPEANTSPNTQNVITRVTFTKGSQTVFFNGGLPSFVTAGNFISPMDPDGPVCSISAIFANTVIISSPYTGDTFTGNALYNPSNVYLLDFDAHFTAGSNQVSFSNIPSGGLAVVQVGDFIRPNSTGGRPYRIEYVRSTYVQLNSYYAGDSITDSAQIQKRDIGQVLVSSYENEGDTINFEYSTEKNQWVITKEGSPAGLYKTGDGRPYGLDPDDHPATADETVVFKEGINLTYLEMGSSTNPDLRYIGTQTRWTKRASSNINTKTFSPCPNPSDLTNPADMDKVHLEIQYGVNRPYHEVPFAQSYTGSSDTSAYFLLSYTNNPMYDGYLPFSETTTNASIHLLNKKEASYSVPSTGFDGSFQLKESVEDSSGDTHKVVVTDWWKDKFFLKKRRGSTSTPLVQNVDYLLDGPRGVITTVDFTEEYPISVIMDKLDPLYTGLVVKTAAVSVNDATDSDFTNGTVLVEGEDFAINSNNGGFAFLKDIQPGYSAQFKYLAKGTPKSINQDIVRGTPEIRLPFFPIITGTIAFQGTYQDNKSLLVTRTMIEGTDFRVFYTNGVIQFADQGTTKIVHISGTYTPASQLTCYAAPRNDDTLFDLKLEQTPSIVTDANTIDTVIRIEGATLQSLSTLSGADVGVTGAVSASTGIFRVPQPNMEMSKDGVALATVSMVSAGIPFAPLVRFYTKYTAGTSDIYLDGVQSSQSGIVAGRALMIGSLNTPSQKELAMVSSVEDIDGINTKVSIYPPLCSDLFRPVLYAADATLSFVDLPEGVTFEAMGSKAKMVVVNGTDDWNIKPGCWLYIAERQIVRVTNVIRTADSVKLTIDPPIVTSVESSTDLQNIKYTVSPVYVKGDNAVIMDNPVVQYGAPAFTLYRKPVPQYADKEIRTEISIQEGILTVTDEIYGISSNEYIVPIYGDTGTPAIENLRDFVNTIATQSAGDAGATGLSSILYYDEIRDLSLMHVYSIQDSQQSINPNQLPYNVLCTPSVFKKDADSSVYAPVSPSSGAYSFVGNVMGLTNTLLANERYKVTYTYVDTNSTTYASRDTISADGLVFRAIPKKSRFKLTFDFLAQDQFYIQSTTESSYLNDSVIPYLSTASSQKAGPSSFGPPDSVDEEGDASSARGVVNNYYQLREYQLMTQLLWKISEYYKYRMGSFASEMEPLAGHRIGNNNFDSTAKAENRMTDYNDMVYQATLGESEFFPRKYRQLSPVPDGRFAQKILAYDRVKLRNIPGTIYYNKKYPWSDELDYDNPHHAQDGLGYLYNPYGDYNRESLNGPRVAVGDQIMLSGIKQTFTVIEVNPAGTIIYLDAHIPTNPKQVDPSVYGGAYTGEFNGKTYFIVKQIKPLYPVLDNRGFDGAVAIGTDWGDEDGDFDYPDGANFTIEVSDDRGTTWTRINHSIKEEDTIFEWESVKNVAKYIFRAFAQDGFSVYAENGYYQPGSQSNFNTTMETSWPIQTPDLEDIDSTGKCLKMYCRTVGRWFRFVEPTRENEISADTLGFDMNVTYISNYNSINCINDTTLQIPHRTQEIISINTSLTTPDRLDRGSTGLWVDLATNEFLVFVDDLNLKPDLEKAYAGSLRIMQEATGSAAPAYFNAKAMQPNYVNYLAETNISINQDSIMSQVMSNPAYNAAINDFSAEYLPASVATQQITTSFETSGRLILTFTSSKGHDPRVVFGNKSTNPSVPCGIDSSYVSVFPTYRTTGTFVSGTWDTTPTTIPSYSDGSSYTFEMPNTDIMFMQLYNPSTIPSPAPWEYQFTQVGLNLRAVGSPTVSTVLFADCVTFGDLRDKIEAVSPLLLLEIYHNPWTYTDTIPCDHFQIMSSYATLDIGDTQELYNISITDDIVFYTMSNVVLDTRGLEANARLAQLNGYLPVFNDRTASIWGSFGYTPINPLDVPENLAANRKYWLNNLLTKGVGPAQYILPYKNKLKE